MASSYISPRDLSPRLAVLCEPEESTPSLPASRSFGAARDGLARQALGVSFAPHLKVAQHELESQAAVESSARDELEHATTSKVDMELDDELAR